MESILFRRPDGSYVADVNGYPYHVLDTDPLFAAAKILADEMGDDLPFEPAPPMPAVTIDDYESAIQSHIDAIARGRQFRDGVTLASYTASTNAAWNAEAQAFIAWRDVVWLYAYQELSKVQAGERTQPTVPEFLTEIVPIIWP